jgi:hypothetical protein
MKRRKTLQHIFVMMGVAGIVIGCKFLSGGATPTPFAEQSLPTGSPTLNSSLAQPLQVTVSLESDRVAQVDVNDQGGQVSAAARRLSNSNHAG